MSQIIKTGSYLPQNKMTNESFIQKYQLDSSDEWIIQRTGIHQRYFAENESVVELAIQSVLTMKLPREIIENIRFIVVASMSSHLPTPSIANQVAQAIGCSQPLCFDISSACSAFITAMDIADKYARTLEDGYTLVIGTEKMSNILSFADRGSCILFGDGAGCVLIKNDGQSLTAYRSSLKSSDTNIFSIECSHTTEHLLAMNGRKVFQFVDRIVIPELATFLQNEVSQVDYLISHQANERLLDMMSKKIGWSRDKIPSNIASVANLSAASIPVLLDEMVQQQQIKLDGSQRIAMCGFGGGLNWGILSLNI